LLVGFFVQKRKGKLVMPLVPSENKKQTCFVNLIVRIIGNAIRVFLPVAKIQQRNINFKQSVKIFFISHFELN
jgi:hypothetical protein